MLYRFVTALNWRQKGGIFLLLDVFSVAVAFMTSVYLMLPAYQVGDALYDLLPMLAILIALAALVALRLDLPYLRLNAYESRGLHRTVQMAVVLGASGALINQFLQVNVPLSLFFVFTLMVAFLGITSRLVLRQITLWIYSKNNDRMRVLIYGAGQTGQQLVAALRTDDKVVPVAFVDDNPTLQSLTAAGLPVFAPSSITELVFEKKIDRVVLAMPSLSQPRQARIAHGLREMGCEVHALPSFAELVGSGDLAKRSSPVAMDDLLGRTGLASELPGVSHAYSNRRILISGAGGSIGSELCRQLIACKPDRVVLLDHSELALYNIDKELRELSTGLKIVPVLGSVCDENLVRQALTEHEIDVVLHAAAYKHLPMVQTNVITGLNNNVIGTKVMADASREAGVERFILVSSDKAVRPTNVMGASKRLAELVVQDLATRSDGTMFSMVRFGNVLGSSGSVVPLFEEQISRGGPVTLTHGAVTRYFMTISEAARLVLLAGSFARGGDVFVLDMGDPVPIKRLAQQMIEAAGYTVRDRNAPNGDIEIKITGLRAGEKLHEELLISPDMLTTPHNKILRAQENYLSEFEVATALKELRLSIDTRDVDGAMAVINRWVESSTEKKPTRVTS